MGDRGNIVVQEAEGKRVYFYTHWRGSDIGPVVTKALFKGRKRWDDPAYLGRIVFCELISQDGSNGTTGFGISAAVCDNSHPILVVDCERQVVRFENENGTPDTDIQESTFEEWANKVHPGPEIDG